MKKKNISLLLFIIILVLLLLFIGIKNGKYEYFNTDDTQTTAAQTTAAQTTAAQTTAAQTTAAQTTAAQTTAAQTIEEDSRFIELNSILNYRKGDPDSFSRLNVQRDDQTNQNLVLSQIQDELLTILNS